jgi:hypothetical protein
METREFKGKLDATGRKFALVVSRFNELIGKQLLAGALDCLERHNAKAADVVWVSGAFEIPAVALRLASMKKYDAVIALGAVIRGDTPHAEYISAEVAKGHRPRLSGDRRAGGVRRHHVGYARAGAGAGRRQVRQQGLDRGPLGHRNGRPRKTETGIERKVRSPKWK